MTDDITREEAHSIFGTWMQHPDETVRTLRIGAMAGALKRINRDRVTECSDGQRSDLRMALGIPEGVAPKPEPGPAISLKLCGEIAARSGIDGSIVTRYLEGVACNERPDEIARRIYPHTDETLLAVASKVNRMRAAAQQIEYDEAEERGELWSIRAALYPGRAFILIRRGREDELDIDAMESQHVEASGFASTMATGTKTDAKAVAAAFLNVEEATIRLVE